MTINASAVLYTYKSCFCKKEQFSSGCNSPKINFKVIKMYSREIHCLFVLIGKKKIIRIKIQNSFMTQCEY